MSDALARLNAALEGRYGIERELGSGGMATVYLARDLRHDRRVALKVLKPELTAVLGGDRFVQEIKTTASLQHPHILPLFDSGTADGFLFYVMPYIEGETLRDKLDRETQLGIDEAVRITRDVADALDYAHRQGIIHRDIKPENILLHDGRPVVADFGIALAVSQAGGARVTETGLSVGTPHYMSPEQAAADRKVDGRTDIYSLGATLYEMLVGHRPFEAASTPALMSKILTEPAPRAANERPTVPPNVDAAVRVALSKLAADRFPTAARFAEALSDRAFAMPTTPAEPTASRRNTAWYVWPVLVAASLVLAWLGWKRPTPPAPVERVNLSLPEGHQLMIWGSRSKPFDISPDGRRLAYQNQVGGTSQLFVRDMDSFEARALDGTTGARHQFFSPDGEWIAFFADGWLQRVSVNGGAPVKVAEAEGASFGGSWGPDGRILYALGGALYLLHAGGSSPARVPLSGGFAGTLADAASNLGAGGQPRWPRILPDGKHALVTTGEGTIAIDLTTFETKYVFEGGQAQYLPTGHLIYHGGQERVEAVPFDLDRLEVLGAEIPVADNVFRGPGSGAANFAVASEAGTLVYAQGGFNRQLVIVDRNGRPEPVPAEARGYRFPAVSPDGRYVAVTVDPRPSDLWIVDLRRGNAERQQTEGHDGWGVWSPDGKRIAFLWGQGNEPVASRAFPLAWRAFPFVSAPVPIQPEGTTVVYPAAWSGDDRLISITGEDIVAVSVLDGSVTPVVATPAAREFSPALSPDGRWLAFVSDASGANEVYVVAYPVQGRRFTVSVGGGVDPVWARNGSELFYRRGNTLFAVPVQTGDGFDTMSPPVELFSRPFDFVQQKNWDVTPDGRFLMIQSDGYTTTRLQVVFNWYEELKQRTEK